MTRSIIWHLDGERRAYVLDRLSPAMGTGLAVERAVIEYNAVPLELPWVWEVYKSSGNLYDDSRSATIEEAMVAAEDALREINF
jgi:hypothetical protein